ncbi:hypothetical protein BpHYR1_054191 [Brachionus plicatilis]|uniref:Uncharacterized protein n=1 Tax=Brachionus plicatilis TaxID=10195 RepID=A0A3M7Q4X0_BRAPC|nr:hypothetical protein BpHYR1_054191 [Brachionus plicatilis]
MFKGVLLISTLFFVSTLETWNIQPKFWLTSCSLSGCSLTLNACHHCYGEKNCKSCITSIKPECSKCVDDIFNQSDLQNVEDNKYLLCDASDSFQVTVCHFHCRGKYYQTGNCIRLNNIPVCQCTSQVSSNSSTTTNPTTGFTEQTPDTTYKTSTFSNGSSTSQSTSPGTFSTTSTLSQSTSPSIISSASTISSSTSTLAPSFNGTLRLNFTISSNYQKIFALPNGEMLRGSYGNAVEVWDMEQGIMKRKLTSIHYYPYLFGLLSNGDLVVGYLDSKTFLIWDIRQAHGEYVKRTIPTNDLIISLSVLNNDDLAIGQQSNNYDILIRDSHSGQIKKRLVGHKNAVYDVITLPDGNLASCSSDGTVRIWDLSSASLINTFVHLSPVYSIALLNNDELIAGLSDGSAEVWNLATGDPTRNFYIHTGAFCRNKCMHVLNSGLVISGSHDFELNVWSSQDGSVKESLRVHKTPIYQLEFLHNVIHRPNVGHIKLHLLINKTRILMTY